MSYRQSLDKQALSRYEAKKKKCNRWCRPTWTNFPLITTCCAPEINVLWSILTIGFFFPKVEYTMKYFNHCTKLKAVESVFFFPDYCFKQQQFVSFQCQRMDDDLCSNAGVHGTCSLHTRYTPTDILVHSQINSQTQTKFYQPKLFYLLILWESMKWVCRTLENLNYKVHKVSERCTCINQKPTANQKWFTIGLKLRLHAFIILQNCLDRYIYIKFVCTFPLKYIFEITGVTN